MAKFDKVIPPGQEGKVQMSVIGERVHGEFNKSAVVHSNDPDHPQTTITVMGVEIPYLSVVPEGTVYLHGHYGEAVEKDLTITSNEKDANLEITGVTSNIDDKMTYRLEPGAQKGEYTIKVFKNPKLPTLSMYGSLFVHTNSKTAPETTIQVHVMTQGSITVSPSMLNFGPIKFADENGPGTPATRSVIVSKATGQFAIKNVTLSNPEFVAVVEPVADGQQYRVQVTFTPPTRRQASQTEAAEMIIHSDDPQEPAIRVQVVAHSM